jgi:hypothetical protein
MAKIQLGVAVSNISGSIEGTTFARNRGGSYIRNKTVPVQPNSLNVQRSRAIVSNLSALWAQTLTSTEREQWDIYASQVLLQDGLGNRRNVGGLGMFIRGNSQLIIAGQLPTVSAPFLQEVGPAIQNMDVSPVVTGGLITIGSFAPITPVTDRVNFFAGPPINPARNYFKGPFRFMGSATVDTAGAAYVSPFPLVEGLQVAVKAVIVTQDGRLGQQRIAKAVILP